MDAIHFAIAIGPLAVYLLALGMLNAMPRGFVTTGTRDLAALGLGVSGLAIAGPLELFLPESAVANYGSFAWILLLVLYGLGLAMVLLMARPRLVIYNVGTDQFRQMLGELGRDLDKEARWAGDTLLLPTLGVQCHLEPFSPLRNIQLMPSGPRQSWDGWKKLQLGIADRLPTLAVRRNPYSYSLLGFGTATLVTIVVWLLADGTATAQAFTEMFRL